jgi:hypothetical protein
MALTKAESDAGYNAAMSFIEKEIANTSLVPSMFSGAAEKGLHAHSALVRQMSDLVAAAVLKASAPKAG